MVRNRSQGSQQLATILVLHVVSLFSWRPFHQLKGGNAMAADLSIEAGHKTPLQRSSLNRRTWSPKCIKNVVQKCHWSPHFPLTISPGVFLCTFLVDIYFPTCTQTRKQKCALRGKHTDSGWSSKFYGSVVNTSHTRNDTSNISAVFSFQNMCLWPTSMSQWIQSKTVKKRHDAKMAYLWE